MDAEEPPKKEQKMSVEARLKENGIELPKASTPAGNYVPYVVNGNTVYISGQIPIVNGEVTLLCFLLKKLNNKNGSSLAATIGTISGNILIFHTSPNDFLVFAPSDSLPFHDS